MIPWLRAWGLDGRFGSLPSLYIDYSEKLPSLDAFSFHVLWAVLRWSRKSASLLLSVVG